MKKNIAMLLITVGIILLGASVWSVFNPNSPYTIHISYPSEELIKIIEKLGLPIDSVQHIEISSANLNQKLANGAIAKLDSQLIPIYWRNEVTEPIFFPDISTDDLSEILKAINQHVPENGVILSWWDLSRSIRSISKRNAPLDDRQARGLLIPRLLTNQSLEESNRWGASVSKNASDMFSQFVIALNSHEQEAFKILSNFSRGGPLFIIVHISDIWKMSAINPDKISIAFKDFPSANLSHGVIKSALEWIRLNEIEGGYASEPIKGAIRLHFFTDKSDNERLIARLLPFSTSMTNSLEHFRLVYQLKGYWIYQVIDNNKL